MRILRQLFLIAFAMILTQTANADWVKLRSASLAWFHDVTFASENNGWIVGSGGTVLATTDGGTTWAPVRKFTNDNLTAIHFTDENTGWILCQRDIYSRGDRSVSYLRKTIDGGRSWETVEFEAGRRERVARLLFDDKGSAVAIGEGGIFYRLSEDGKAWKRSGSSIKYLLLGGDFFDGSFGAIVGAGGTVMFTDDYGVTWEPATLLGNKAARFNSVFFSSRKYGWAVGTGGAIIASVGSGRLWREQLSGVDAELTDVFFTNDRRGWAVGDRGTIIRTTNGGGQWIAANSLTEHRLERVYFNKGKGWAVGFGGTILRYSDDRGQSSEGRPEIRSRTEQP
ncbi:MAG: hypothetical protein K1X36_03555 [Pyrinomonadaceae bacterium]|nr:hypothetical protein [Pyrinomonadaceae bacterium]